MVSRLHRLGILLEPLALTSRCGIVGGAGVHGEDLLLLEPDTWLAPTNREDACKAIREADRMRRHRIVSGWLAYELGSANQGALRPSPSVEPLLELGAFHSRTIGDSEQCYRAGPFRLSDFRLDLSESEYRSRVAEVLEEIAKGNVYQVNLTLRLRFRFEGDPRSLFLSLFRSQPARYASLFRSGNRWVLSLSPELFLRWHGDEVEMRPMKGTAPRGRHLIEDDRQSAWLREDSKSLAENLMILDLIRNDLGRVARYGSLRVRDVFRTEVLPTLIQMTSTAEATLRPGWSLSELFNATFPCGSVTGAPKLAAMKLIENLETGPRGVYCGAIGCMSADRGQWAVGIRTLVLERTNPAETRSEIDPKGVYDGVLGIGSGIVSDSDPAQEWKECRLKARFVTSPYPRFQLLESLCWDSEAARLEDHLDRLDASARYFGVAFDRAAIRRSVLELGRRSCRSGAFKLRILLDADGRWTVEHTALEALVAPVRVALADERTDPRDSFLYHKTTHRERYDKAQRAAREHGFWDLLFRNRRNEITEGSISNVFARFGDRWVTPPLECGLLPGVMRTHAIRELNAAEEVLGFEELERADEIVLTNSVRGYVPVRLLGRVVEVT